MAAGKRWGIAGAAREAEVTSVGLDITVAPGISGASWFITFSSSFPPRHRIASGSRGMRESSSQCPQVVENRAFFCCASVVSGGIATEVFAISNS